MDPVERLTVLVTRARALARGLEACLEVGVFALLRRGAGHAFPFGASLLELLRRVFTAQRVDSFAESGEGGLARSDALGFRSPLGLFAPEFLDRSARRRHPGLELFAQRPFGERRDAAPLFGRFVELQ